MDQVRDPALPYIEPIRGGEFGPGRMIRIQGSTSPVGKVFNINLQCGPRTNPRDDLSLHLSVRFTEGIAARNTLQNGMWEEEQRSGVAPIAAGESFEIIILSEPKVYKLALNGQHFCEFTQKIPSFRVSHLSIDGDVSITLISYEGIGPIVTAPPVGGDATFQKEPLTQAPFGGFGAPGAPYTDAPPPYGGPPPGQFGGTQGPYGAPPGPYGQPPGPYGPGTSPYGGTTQPYGAPGPYGGAPGAYGGTPMPYGPPGTQPQSQSDSCGPSWDCCGCKVSLGDILCWTALYCCCRMLCDSFCNSSGGS